MAARGYSPALPYLLHISFSPLHALQSIIVLISHSVRIDAADLHYDLLLSELQNS